MKLAELKRDTLIQEGLFPPHWFMAFEKVIRDGGLTDPSQAVFMAHMMEWLNAIQADMKPVEGKDFNITMRDYNRYECLPKKEVIHFIKSTQPTDQVKIAEWLLGIVHFGEVSKEIFCDGCGNSTLDYARWVLKRQD